MGNSCAVSYNRRRAVVYFLGSDTRGDEWNKRGLKLWGGACLLRALSRSGHRFLGRERDGHALRSAEINSPDLRPVPQRIGRYREVHAEPAPVFYDPRHQVTLAVKGNTVWSCKAPSLAANRPF